MSTPDRKIAQQLASMKVAGDPKAAKLMAMLVANGTVDLGHMVKITDKAGNETSMTFAQAVGRGAMDGNGASNLLEIANTIGEDALCQFFDWTVGNEHIASKKVKAISAKPQGNTQPANTARNRQRGNDKLTPTTGLDLWVGLLCRNRPIQDVLDGQAMRICMSARMPHVHDAIARQMPADSLLPDGSRLWGHARSAQQFEMLARDDHALENTDLMMELSDACNARRANGKPSAFANALDKDILGRLASQPITDKSRQWINRRCLDLAHGKNSKWVDNTVVLMWAKAWMQANPGQDIGENIRIMLLDRRNMYSSDVLEHYGAIIQDQALFQAVGKEAMGQRLLEIAYQRFRSKGQTRHLAALTQHLGWPQEGRPHLVRLGTAPTGADKSGKKESLANMAEILGSGGEPVWGNDAGHTAGLLLARIHQIAVQGGDDGPGSTMQTCLATLNRVLENGRGNEHHDALRFCGALSTYLVVQHSPMAKQCLQVMAETAGEAEAALARVAGASLHEILDDIKTVLKNSKKLEPFEAFAAMVSMRERTDMACQATTIAPRPRF